jgi:hypothetical protein
MQPEAGKDYITNTKILHIYILGMHILNLNIILETGLNCHYMHIQHVKHDVDTKKLILRFREYANLTHLHC